MTKSIYEMGGPFVIGKINSRGSIDYACKVTCYGTSMAVKFYRREEAEKYLKEYCDAEYQIFDLCPPRKRKEV